MKRVLGYLKPEKFRLVITFIIKFMGTIMDLFIPWILSHILDVVAPSGNRGDVFLWGGIMFLCTALAWIGNVVANRMASATAKNTTEKIRHDLFDKILHISGAQRDHFTVPSLVSRLTSDTYNVHQMLGAIQRLGVRAPILLLGGLIITMIMDPFLTLVLVSLLPFICIMVYFVSKIGTGKFKKVQKAVDSLVRSVQENISGVRVIRALSKNEYERRRCEKISEDIYNKEMSAGSTMSLTSPIMNVILNIGLVLVIIVGAFRVNVGKAKVGVIIAFLTYFTIILNAMLMVTRIFNMLSKAAASADRIAEVLDAPEELPLGGGEDKEEYKDYHIVFDNVSFSYEKDREPVLKNISFKLKKGETLGITGQTGKGKSTIISLLLRFYDADEGNIYIFGTNIKNIPEKILHTMFGVTFQNDFLFADTMKENIVFGREISEDALADAIKCAQAEEIIASKDGGLESLLTIKGANLSGGQKQRVLIARALCAKPQILILDDASSALDYKTDAKFRRALREEYGNTTSVIVSQRFSSIQFADVILNLDEEGVK